MNTIIKVASLIALTVAAVITVSASAVSDARSDEPAGKNDRT